MNITCGPDADRRTIRIKLPTDPSRIGVLVSGGIDSAILYYIIIMANKIIGNIHSIQPLTVIRKEGSRHFANLVVAHVHTSHGIPVVESQIIGDNTLPEEEQVKSAVVEATTKLGFDQVYAGVIEQLPQFMVNWQPIPSKETRRFKTPLANIDKSHVIDLCVKFKQESLFYITHSCSVQELGRCNDCNGCNERSWGFEQTGIIDKGTL
jgi:7-cyano-7-deazaguanine synthase in queuosine biosynthesis